MVWYSNGRFMCYVLRTKLNIQILDQYIRKQDVVHLFGIPMVGLSGIQMAFEYSDHINTQHLNTGFIRIPDFLVSGIKIVVHKNGYYAT